MGTARGEPPEVALLSLAGVTRTHPVGRELRPMLDDVSLDVWPGDVVAIWGLRRSGKTTLLRVAAGIEIPDAGTVRIGGYDLARLSRADRTRCLRQVGYAAKEWRVAAGKPVLDHVALPLLAEGRPLATAMAKAYEAVDRVGASACVDAYLHDLLPADMTRMALAQALVRDPLLLLVDEPGAAVAPEEREALLRLLRSLVADSPELALVLTSRDVAGLGGAPRVMSIGDGQLRSFETPAEILPFPTRSRPAAEPVP
jgi:putative ABC transport system ATP-binding protein